MGDYLFSSNRYQAGMTLRLDPERPHASSCELIPWPLPGCCDRVPLLASAARMADGPGGET